MGAVCRSVLERNREHELVGCASVIDGQISGGENLQEQSGRLSWCSCYQFVCDWLLTCLS